MNQTAALQIGDISRADFRTSFAADSENSRIQKALALPFRYQPARLALSLSLRRPDLPAPINDGGGRPIKGDTLFGQDEADLTLWIALIVQHCGQSGLSRRAFQDLVAAHWARGMDLLSRSITGAATIEQAFARLLAERPTK
ncbi:DndE family protein [Devosia aurantiaca]|uniref:DndE family protein n=1 Tax=Devosia aurantiaca TaxID=2714858 RepID=A0A6M1S941_9HYPH|nr:DndE family protein [Devosia aurantiaca]NGP16529.1 DndE family protein [Devosia aurantiaca]